MIVISTLLGISSSVRDIERLLRESPPFRTGRMSNASTSLPFAFRKLITRI
jgi:hypothetical protein